MDKIKQKKHSLKWCMMLYLPFCLIAAVTGAMLIGFGINDLQHWYMAKHPDINLSSDIAYEINVLQANQAEVEAEVEYIPRAGEDISISNLRYFIVYWVISYAQAILMPGWVIFCIAIAGIIFYNRELKKPIEILLGASRKIADNQLDFKVESLKQRGSG